MIGVRRAWVIVFGLVLLIGCGRLPAAPTAVVPGVGEAAPQPLALTYRASGGRLPVDLDLKLHATGQAELFLGTSYTLPLARVNRVGRFAGAVPAAQLVALRASIDQHDLLARGGSYGVPDPDAPVRELSISADGAQTTIRLHGASADPDFDALEQVLQQLALALTAYPVQAVEATLDLARADDALAATLALRALGTQPFTVLFVDPAQPTPAVRAELAIAGQQRLPSGATMPLPMGSAALTPDAVVAQVRAGTLPEGVVQLPLDQVVTIELPRIALAPTTLPLSATGTLRFLVPEGQARRELVVLTPDVPLPPSP